MKKSPQHLAFKSYQQLKGNFRTLSPVHFKKESDLGAFYYPGVSGIQKKMAENPELEAKLSKKILPIGLLSTQPKSFYPVLTAKASLLSMLSGMNVIPLLIRYEHFENLPQIVSQMAINFQAVFLAGLRPAEQEVLKNSLKPSVPLLFLDEMEALTTVAAISNAAKLLKKSPKSLRITLEGSDHLMRGIVKALLHEGFTSLTLIDERGPLYRRRPNMNKHKNELATLAKSEKIKESREEVLARTDIFLSTLGQKLEMTTTKLLPDKCVLVTLRSEAIEAKPRQTIISNLPHLPNHLTDLHIAAVLGSALGEGKQMNEKTIARAVRGLSTYYRNPTVSKIIPGLLEKNLVRKLVKSL